MLTPFRGKILIYAATLGLLGVLLVVGARTWSQRRDASVAQDLAQQVRNHNAKTAKGLELRLWGNPDGFTAVLRNASGGPLRVYPPVRNLSLFVTLYDANGERYEPPTHLAPHPTQTGGEPVPLAPHGKAWEEGIRLKDLREEFENLDGAAYLVARYKLHTRQKRTDVVDAEVWSNPVRLR